jgi:hypothetical protein
MLPVAQWYAALMGPPLIVAGPPAAKFGKRATVSRLLGHGLIRLGRTLSRRGPRVGAALAHRTLAR